MKDEDLRRRLEKLTALRDHPSTLPAIRGEAAKAYERLHARYQDDPRACRGPVFSRRLDLDDPVWNDLLGVMNRETRKIWKKVKPAPPGY